MPKQIILALMIEASLIVLTTLFLTRPGFVFQVTTDRIRWALTFSGMVFLGLTFCWSFILGCIIAFSRFSISI